VKRRSAWLAIATAVILTPAIAHADTGSTDLDRLINLLHADGLTRLTSPNDVRAAAVSACVLLEAGWSEDRVVSAAMVSASTPEWVTRDDMAAAVSDFAEVYCPDAAG